MDREAIFFLCVCCYLGLLEIVRTINNQTMCNLENSLKLLSVSCDVRSLKCPGILCSSWYNGIISFKSWLIQRNHRHGESTFFMSCSGCYINVSSVFKKAVLILEDS